MVVKIVKIANTQDFVNHASIVINLGNVKIVNIAMIVKTVCL